MKEEESVRVFDLVIKSGSMPTTLDKLVPLSFIGAAAVKFYRAKVKLMDQLGMSEAQRKATLADGQDAGEMLLNIEARIGELSKDMPRTEPEHKGPGSGAAQGPLKHQKLDIARSRMVQAQAIHRNPAAVARVIKEAKENEDIPTKTAVLKQIQLDRVKEMQKERVPEDERIKGILGEDEFSEWTQWMRIRAKVRERIGIEKMSVAARREIRKVIEGILKDIGDVCNNNPKLGAIS